MWVVTWVALKCKPPILLLLNPASWSPTPNRTHVLFHAQPTCLARTSFHSEWWRVFPWWFPGLLWRHTPPASWGPSGFSLSSLPHRNLSLPLLLWTSSQPKCVAEPGGKLVVWGGDGMLSLHQPLLLLLCGLMWGVWPHCPSPIVLSAGVWPNPVLTRFYSTQLCLPALLRRIQVRPLYWGKQVSLVAPWYVWLYTFVCGACSSVLVCWCSEKEAWVSMYKKVFRARHNDVDLLMSTRIDIISMSVTDPKYPGFSSL